MIKRYDLKYKSHTIPEDIMKISKEGKWIKYNEMVGFFESLRFTLLEANRKNNRKDSIPWKVIDNILALHAKHLYNH